jgi:RNA polymerase-interacting CarD/CdnL/TRCF family regulator
MSLLNKVKRLLDLVDGHEDAVARQVSKRTSASENQVKEGIAQVREAVEDLSNDNTDEKRS